MFYLVPDCKSVSNAMVIGRMVVKEGWWIAISHIPKIDCTYIPTFKAEHSKQRRSDIT